MSIPQYRLTVIACALAWLLVGMHAPVVHQITAACRVLVSSSFSRYWC